MSRFRVVLDTNCYISALLYGGRTALLRTAWENGLFVPVMCDEAIAELEDVLWRRKFIRVPSDRKEIGLANVRFHAEMFVLRHPSAPVPGLRDPKDIVFVNLAREAKADYLVSGDAHLLELKETITDVKIISPREFLRKLGWSATE